MQHEVSRGRRAAPVVRPPIADGRPESPAQRVQGRYWRKVLAWTLGGVLAWLAVTCIVSWFAEGFNRWTVAGAPAGFWLAAQGAIGAYLVIILLHDRVMDHLEARRDAALDGSEASSGSRR